MDIDDIEKELFDLCEDMIITLYELKCTGQISENEYQTHVEQKVKLMNYFLSKQGWD